MARYRVGDMYLSEQEYQEHVDEKWVFWLFVIGAIVGGYSVYYGLSHFGINNLEKWQKFSLIVFVSTASGYLLSKLRKTVKFLIALFFILAIIQLIFVLLWEFL